MNTFLSILSIKTNSFSNEKIVVGLLAITNDKIHFAYSKEKLKILNKITKNGDDVSHFADSVLKQIKKSVISSNHEIKSKDYYLFKSKSIFNESYFHYLNQYNNGILHFSKPYEIHKEFSDFEFKNYFGKFVGDWSETKNEPKHTTFYKKIQPYFKKTGLNEKADLNFTLNSNNFKGILKDCQIPLITKNGNINALQVIDFEMHPNTITGNLYETKIIYDALNGFAPSIKTSIDKIKVAYQEPPIPSKQHKLFDLAVKEYKDFFEFITPNEVDSFTENILNSNYYTKFSDLI